jgi:branched-chain amino acid transport system substrate-binding protein
MVLSVRIINMKKTIIGIIIILVIIGIVSLVYKPRDTSTIKVAFISSLSGDAASWGENLKTGFDFALDEINSNGGINGRMIEVTYEDDKCESATGVSVFNKAINIDKAKIITGTVCSSVAMSVAKTTQANQVIYIASGATSPEVPKQGDMIFRLWVSDAYEAIAMGEYAVNNLELKTFAIAHTNDNPAGIALGENFQSTIKKLGGEITGVESYSGKEKDFKAVLTKLISKNPEALYLMALPEQTSVIINQARDLGYKGHILGYSPALLAPQTISQIKDKSKLYYSTPIVGKETNFWNDYKNKFGKEADSLVALGYDSLKILVPALEKCGENNECIKDFLLNQKDYQSPRGKINFDQDGDLTKVDFETVLVK